MPNRLAHETSPYLLQHQHNPVDWYPWGEAALARARQEEKPIFLSIGYSACHWCHVMERESFEQASIAAQMNEQFVCIKVDREERPDLDQIYMNAVQLMTGHGGWPMSVFLTPDLKPFYGGTYWPPTAARGMPGFDQVLAAVADAWYHRRSEALAGADQLTAELEQLQTKGVDPATVALSENLLHAAGHVLERMFDATHGGFGPAPKFPHPLELQLLLRWWQRTGSSQWLAMIRTSLDRMAAGGMYDHLGGGFARYCVDAAWQVPHFEKMLYDNALLAVVYLEAHLATGEPRYATVVRETLDYILRDMTDPAGGFYSAEDADSEGVEGKFYVWTIREIKKVLGDAAGETFCQVYGVTEAGNFEGANILHRTHTLDEIASQLGREPRDLAAELATSCEQLLAARDQRVRPGKDDKVIAGWNGLMIDALARAGAALDEPRYITAARQGADFLLTELRTDAGRLLHTWRGGTAKLAAYLDDYTTLANALVSLYEVCFDERYLTASAELLDTVVTHFGDSSAAGFFYTADDHEQLLTRNKDLTDNATPGGNSMAAMALLRLGKILGRSDYLDTAHALLQAASPLMQQIPLASGQMLQALDLWLGPTPELLLVGPQAEELAQQVHARFLPRRVVMAQPAPPAAASPLAERFSLGAMDPRETALYICEQQTCRPPVLGEEAIGNAIRQLP